MRASLLAIALVVALAGCGDDDKGSPLTADDLPSLTPTATDASDPSGSGSGTPTKTTTPRLPRSEARAARRAFDTWLGAFGAGNPDRACPLQTKKFTQQQIKRLAERDRIERGASCDDLVTIIGILFEALRLDVADARVEKGPSAPDEIAFSVKFKKFATLGYGMVKTDDGWRVDEDLTVS